MAMFEDILAKARDIVEAAKDKTGEVVDKTKLKMTISDLEKKLAATFEGIGRLVYDAQVSGEDIEALKADAFETVKELQAELASLQAKLYEMDGVVCCTECGAPNEKDAAFCKKCGKAL